MVICIAGGVVFHLFDMDLLLVHDDHRGHSRYEWWQSALYHAYRMLIITTRYHRGRVKTV